MNVRRISVITLRIRSMNMKPAEICSAVFIDF